LKRAKVYDTFNGADIELQDLIVREIRIASGSKVDIPTGNKVAERNLFGVQHLINFLFVPLNSHSFNEVIYYFLSASMPVNPTYERNSSRDC
jgi:hypothetical protein